MSNSLSAHGLQHSKLPCPSPTPGTCSDSCPLSQWCHPTISSSVAPFPFAFNLSQHRGVFWWISSSQQVAKVLELQHQSFWKDYSGLISFRVDWFDLLAAQGTLKSLHQHPDFKASVLPHSVFMVQLSHLCMTTGKTIAWTILTFVSKVRSLLFITLSRFVIAFLLRSRHLLISFWQSLSTVILKPRKIKSATVSTSPSICHEVMGLDAMIFIFCMLIFKPAFSSSLLYAFRVVSSVHLRNLDSSFWFIQPTFHIMYSACKLNKQGDITQCCCAPFPVWNQSVVPGPVQTVASWPVYRFLRRQVRWSGILSLVEFSTVCHDPPCQRL